MYTESITDVIVPEYEMNHIQIKEDPYERDYTIGVDIAKRIFQVHGVDEKGSLS